MKERWNDNLLGETLPQSNSKVEIVLELEVATIGPHFILGIKSVKYYLARVWSMVTNQKPAKCQKNIVPTLLAPQNQC